jgi:hypothetical protein
MNEREGFLSRWSRKKREAEKESAHTPAHPRAGGNPDEESMDSRFRENERKEEAAASRQGSARESAGDPQQEPEFDLSHLPSLDDITAETDIRPFLARGVPASLRQAALRRMWVADPKIRDFIGIAENQWDFTVQGATPGFDLAPPTGDIARLVADMFSPKSPDESVEQRERAADASRQAVGEPNEKTASDHISVNAEEAPRRDANATEQSEAVRRTDVADAGTSVTATQQDAAPPDDASPAVRRSHGGAMPK